jgi:hypothetical protein
MLTLPSRSAIAAVIVGMMLIAATGCDDTPGAGALDQQAPRVVDFRYTPDSVVVSTLPDDRVQDSLAEVELAIDARVQDADSDVASVLFTLEPASNPRQTALGSLRVVTDAPSGPGELYAARAQLRLPAIRREIYTLRVYAIDTDSLPSNQATGQIRLIPEE